MEHIKKQLNINLNKKGLSKMAEAAYICYIFENLKKELLGENINAEALSFKNGTLKIKVRDSVSASEIRFKSEGIKSAINKKIGHNVILKIDTRIV